MAFFVTHNLFGQGLFEMRKASKLTAFLMAVCMSLALFSFGALGNADMAGQTVVLYTANVRANVDVLPKVAALKTDYAARGVDVVLVDAGNFLQGSLAASYDSGKTIVALMDEAGYDAAAIGIYEFAFGTGQVSSNHGTVYEDGTLGQFLAEASFAGVSANVLSGGVPAYAENTIVTTASGQKVGFFGITAPQAVSMISEAGVRGLSFTSGAAVAAAQAAALQDCDIVIGLSNAGGLSDIDGAVMIDVGANTGQTVGVVVIDNATGAVVSREAVDLASVTGDAAVQAAVDAVHAAMAEEYGAGTTAISEVTLNGAMRDVRAGESNLGNLWADALRWFAIEGGIGAYYDEDDINNGNTGIQVDAENVIALWNGGNLRDSIHTGVVTMKELSRVLPYPNSVAVVYLTGAQLLEHLEATSQGLPYATVNLSPLASFMQASGIRYRVDASMAYNAGPLYRTNWYRAESVNRVSIQDINGKPFDAEALYAIITSNANYNGMDASYVCLDKDEDKSVITSARVTDVVWMYIQQELGGVIGQRYAAPEGRIVVNTAYADVAATDAFASAVDFATENGIMRGVSDGKFEPAASINRAALVAALYNLAGAPATEISGKFVDVAEEAWYAKAVTWAVDEGITSGTGENAFSPEGTVSRQELAVFIYRFAGAVVPASEVEGEDAAEVAAWAQSAVAYFYQEGYLGLSGTAAFEPNAPVSRGDVALVLQQAAAR